jgi:hypothetical protein
MQSFAGNFRRRFPAIVVGLLACVGVAQPALAGLIGDSIVIRRLYPNLGTDWVPSRTVIAQTGLDAGASPQPLYYAIDLEATSLSFDFGPQGGLFGGKQGPVYNSSNPFDGLSFSGFSGSILGASVASNVGIDVAELFVANNVLYLNLAGQFDDSSSLNLSLQFADDPNVPEPTLLSLVAAALASAAFRMRRTT